MTVDGIHLALTSIHVNGKRAVHLIVLAGFEEARRLRQRDSQQWPILLANCVFRINRYPPQHGADFTVSASSVPRAMAEGRDVCSMSRSLTTLMSNMSLRSSGTSWR